MHSLILAAPLTAAATKIASDLARVSAEAENKPPPSEPAVKPGTA